MGDLAFIQEQRELHTVDPGFLDSLLDSGWRHHASLFFRYNFCVLEGKVHHVWPLRVELDGWTPTRSQRRVMRRNGDLKVVLRPAERSIAHDSLFHRHAKRFSPHSRPSDLGEFLGDVPASQPCPIWEVAAYLGETLIASSYIAVSDKAVSSIYAMFEPEECRRSLGIFTMLQEIEFARQTGRSHHYPGYATMHHSIYDYKKGFRQLQFYGWQGCWHPLPRDLAHAFGEAPSLDEIMAGEQNLKVYSGG
jgi:leucyl-tRNA---protein transferase